MSDLTLDPATTALMVMDFQHGIVGRIPQGEALVARTAELIAEARAAGLAVGFVRVAFVDEDFDAIPETHAFAATVGSPQARAAFHADAPTTQIVDALAPQDGDIMVRKQRVGPFTTTDLQAQLDAKGITTLVLTGISTSGVVLSTVRQAVDHDYRVVVVSDLVADTDDEVHTLLTEKVFPKQGEVVTADEVSAALRA